MPDRKTLALGDLDHELKLTRFVLAAIPSDRLDWRPHKKSMAIGGLGIHLGNIPIWQAGILSDTEFDLSTLPRRSEPPTTTGDILANFDRNAAMARAAMDALAAEDLASDWTLRHGEKVFFTRPRFVVLRDMGISHMVHHRGQLTVYLRLLDVLVPATYGPTADAQPTFA